jgi:nitrile hydratase accessory protein
VTGRGGQADTSYLLDAAGPAAPPRDNGELVFAAPWESQAFGLALALREAGHIGWEDFRQRLITEIASWEASHGAGDEWSYYRCWLRALEQAVSSRGLVGAADLRDRTAALAARPPEHGSAEPGHGHDHGHDHAVPVPAGASQ